MKRPGDNEPEPPEGRAAERLREFLRQRLPADASPEEIRAETERGKAKGTEGTQGQTETEQGPSAQPQKRDPGSDNPE
jgi:hypothetical protein